MASRVPPLAALAVATALLLNAASSAGQTPLPSAAVPGHPGVTPAAPIGPADASPSPAPLVDPRCDAFLAPWAVEAATGLVVATIEATDHADRDPPLEHITCRWQDGAGRGVTLEVEDLLFGAERIHLLVQEGALSGLPVEDLGDEAYAGTDGSGSFVAWAVSLDDVDRTLTLRGGDLDPAVLVTLGRSVAVDARPDDAGSSPTPGPDARALIGEWMLVSWSAHELTGVPPIILSLGTDGMADLAFACQPPGGRDAPLWTGPYGVAGDAMTIALSGPAGACRSRRPADLVPALTDAFRRRASPGTWSVKDGTLTLGGPSGTPILAFERVAAP